MFENNRHEGIKWNGFENGLRIFFARYVDAEIKFVSNLGGQSATRDGRNRPVRVNLSGDDCRPQSSLGAKTPHQAYLLEKHVSEM